VWPAWSARRQRDRVELETEAVWKVLGRAKAAVDNPWFLTLNTLPDCSVLIRPTRCRLGASKPATRPGASLSLHTWAENPQYSIQVRYLCGATIYVQGRTSPRPQVGAPGFMGGTSGPTAHSSPFTFVGSIPFIIVRSYILVGRSREPRALPRLLRNGGEEFLDLFAADSDSLHQALDTILHSSTWKAGLTSMNDNS